VLAVVVGRTPNGRPFLLNLEKVPNVLIAGAGKDRVAGVLHAMILSLLCRAEPEDVRLVLIDPAGSELTRYAGVPHLGCEVITDPGKAFIAFRNLNREMNRRYQILVRLALRNIADYNRRARGGSLDRESPHLTPMPLPRLAVFVSELASLPVEAAAMLPLFLTMARTAGIYLLLSTQRPSAGIVRDTLGNGMAGRIAFRVRRAADSRAIRGRSGAEALATAAEMLYLGPRGGRTQPVRSVRVNRREVVRVVEFLRRGGRREDAARFFDGFGEERGSAVAGAGRAGNELFRRARKTALAARDRKA